MEFCQGAVRHQWQGRTVNGISNYIVARKIFKEQGIWAGVDAGLRKVFLPPVQSRIQLRHAHTAAECPPKMKRDRCIKLLLAGGQLRRTKISGQTKLWSLFTPPQMSAGFSLIVLAACSAVGLLYRYLETATRRWVKQRFPNECTCRTCEMCLYHLDAHIYVTVSALPAEQPLWTRYVLPVSTKKHQRFDSDPRRPTIISGITRH